MSAAVEVLGSVGLLAGAVLVAALVSLWTSRPPRDRMVEDRPDCVTPEDYAREARLGSVRSLERRRWRG